MPTIPLDVDDEVLYTIRKVYLSRDTSVTIQTRLDFWGTVFFNGSPIANIGAIPMATKAQAEAGTDNSVVMSPLRSREGDAYYLEHLPDLKNIAWPKARIYGNDNQFNFDVNVGGSYKFMVDGASKLQLFDTTMASKVPHYLSRDPVDPTEAATKAYVDSLAGSGVVDGDKGEISVTGGLWVIDNSVITNTKLANMAASTLKGKSAGGAGAPTDLTPAQARTIIASDSGGGTTNFFAADGTWATPAGGGAGVTDGDKGDIVVSGSGATWMFDSTVVTPAAKTVLDDTSVANMRTTLGVVNKAGDTMTGQLAVQDYVMVKGTPPTWYFADASGAIYNAIQGTSQGWFFDIGANSSYEFSITDTGVSSTIPIQLPAADPTFASQAASKGYVDKGRYGGVTNIAGTTYTLALADEPNFLNFTAATAITLTVPTNATVALPIGCHIDFVQTGAGKITVSGAGVSLIGTPSLTLRAAGSAASLVKIATNTWVLTGDLT